MFNVLQPHLTGGIFLVLLKGCASSVTSFPEWSGFLGRSLSVVCGYDNGYGNYNKYWCRGVTWGSCKTVVETTGSEEEVRAGRTSIKDNKILSEFTVRLDNLTEQDAGVYWCAIERTGSDRGFRVNIIVLPGGFSGSVNSTSSSVGVPVGRSLFVMCHYTEDYRTNKKYWCRGEHSSSCEKVITTETALVVKEGRVSINDNRSFQFFTVITENLTLKDAGQYWCGIDIPRRRDDYYSVIVNVFSEPSTTAAVTTVPTVPSSPPTMTKSPISNLSMIPVLLPLVFLLLLAFLVGALLMMCRLKKQKAAKASRAIPLSTASSSTRGNISRAAAKPTARFPIQTAPHCSHQSANGTDVEYSSVITTPALHSQPQMPTEGVSYATLNFSAQHEQTIYANV